MLNKMWVKRTPKGALLHTRWQAFLRYLNDFSRMQEAPPASLALWEQFLVYGVALGVAEHGSRRPRGRLDNYISRDDEVGERFAKALISKSGDGVGRMSNGKVRRTPTGVSRQSIRSKYRTARRVGEVREPNVTAPRCPSSCRRWRC